MGDKPTMILDLNRYRCDKYALFNAIKQELKLDGRPQFADEIWEKIKDEPDWFETLRKTREIIDLKML